MRSSLEVLLIFSCASDFFFFLVLGAMFCCSAAFMDVCLRVRSSFFSGNYCLLQSKSSAVFASGSCYVVLGCFMGCFVECNLVNSLSLLLLNTVRGLCCRPFSLLLEIILVCFAIRLQIV